MLGPLVLSEEGKGRSVEGGCASPPKGSSSNLKGAYSERKCLERFH